MTDNINDILHNITMEYLINKQYHVFFKKDGEILNSINKRDQKFYKKRILQVTRDLFLNDDFNVSPDVKDSYNNYIKHCIEYFKMIDKSDIIQKDYNENPIIIENDNEKSILLEDDHEKSIVIENDNNLIGELNNNYYNNENSILFNKTKKNTLDNFVKKITIENKNIQEFIPRKRRINLKDPLLKIKGVNNNIINNYEKDNEKKNNEEFN